ncbi:MAG: hypothetical protein ACO25B_08830 [Chitinophagaceae bacterium]
MKKTIVTLILGSTFFVACQKEDLMTFPSPEPQVMPLPCISQTENPAGRTYETDSLVSYPCTEKYCGLMPLSAKSFWIYEDSVFDNGLFVRVQRDTLKYTKSFRSVTDNLTWWESDLFVGLPRRLYSNDSAIFLMQERNFNPDLADAKKEYSLFTGDSLRYLTGFDDMAAMGRSLKLGSDIITPAGSFNGCLFFEKNARNFRKEQVIFKPGVGVLKFIQEQAPMGTRELKMQHILTLIAFQIP